MICNDIEKAYKNTGCFKVWLSVLYAMEAPLINSKNELLMTLLEERTVCLRQKRDNPDTD